MVSEDVVLGLRRLEYEKKSRDEEIEIRNIEAKFFELKAALARAGMLTDIHIIYPHFTGYGHGDRFTRDFETGDRTVGGSKIYDMTEIERAERIAAEKSEDYVEFIRQKFSRSSK